jgi:hypothetical protein
MSFSAGGGPLSSLKMDASSSIETERCARSPEQDDAERRTCGKLYAGAPRRGRRSCATVKNHIYHKAGKVPLCRPASHAVGARCTLCHHVMGAVSPLIVAPGV